ncbi:MAG: hypothetical protein PHD53_05570 [Methylococcales bacterium]|nr:hypothetical protein [Methylococcales bacterium]
MSLLTSYLKLCWFKSDPTDLMPSRAFSRHCIIFYFISGIIVEGLIADFADGSLEVSLRAVMAFSSVATFLFFHKNLMLFQRVFTAIFVCENFIMVLAILCEVLDFWLVTIHYEYHDFVGIGLAVFLVSWYLAIVAYILRRFFQYNVGRSLSLAFSYFILTYGIPMLFMDI